MGGFKDGNVGNGLGSWVNSAGTAVGYAEKYDASDLNLGPRAVRWDASGATELGNLGTDTSGLAYAQAFAINIAGTAAGYAEKYDGSGAYNGTFAVRWDASGTAATELGNLGTDTSGLAYAQANAINTAGTAAGYSVKYDGSGAYLGWRAVRWDASGTAATELGNLGTNTEGFTNAYAYAINTAGTAVGVAEPGSGGGWRAVRWDASGTAATELGNLGTDPNTPGYTHAGAVAINTAGTAVGAAITYAPGGGDRAVRWAASGTAATELGNLDLGTSYYSPRSAYANAINTAGTAVGTASKHDGSGTYYGSRAVRWDASGTAATELGNLGTDTSGYTLCDAYAINTAGTAAGFAEKYDGSGTLLGDRAVFWGDDGFAIDLNTLIDPASGWTLLRARAISDTNFVAGEGLFDPDGIGGQAAYSRLFVLDASSGVPEPGSIGLLALGGVTLLRRRRRV